jgi:hypothetical protein
MNEPTPTTETSGDDELAALLANHRHRAARMLDSQRSRVQRFDQTLNQNFDDFVSQVATLSTELIVSNNSDSVRPHTDSDPTIAIRPMLDSFWERLEDRLDDLQSAPVDYTPDTTVTSTSGEAQLEIESLEEQVHSLRQQLRATTAEKNDLILEVQEVRDSLGDGLSSPGLDWETEKRRVLASLEADDLDDSPTSREDRSNVQNTIRISDRIIAEKDREIVELNQLLEQQSGNIGDVAIGAAAIGATLDNDELVQQERERLVVLQQEWTEKLRKAEVEISVERATFAREKAAFATQKQKIINLLEKHNLSLDDIEDEPKVEVRRGRWREKLGITDDEDS